MAAYVGPSGRLGGGGAGERAGEGTGRVEGSLLPLRDRSEHDRPCWLLTEGMDGMVSPDP